MVESLPSFILSDAFWGAVVGGLLTATGSVLTLYWQQRSQSRDRRATAKAVFYEHACHIRQMSEKLINHFDNKNEIWFEYTNQIDVITNIVNRNLEWLAILQDEKAKEAVRSYFSDVFYTSQRAVYWQKQFYRLKDDFNKIDPADEPEINRLKVLIGDSFVEMKVCIVDMRKHSIECDQLFSKLN